MFYITRLFLWACYNQGDGVLLFVCNQQWNKSVFQGRKNGLVL